MKAIQIERNFTKEEIFALYCNQIYFGHGNYGVEAAARNYFNKSVADLSLVEAATLAGIPQRPSAFNVYRNPEAVVERRNVVLQRMFEEEYITTEELEKAKAEPLIVVPLLVRVGQELGALHIGGPMKHGDRFIPVLDHLFDLELHLPFDHIPVGIEELHRGFRGLSFETLVELVGLLGDLEALLLR